MYKEINSKRIIVIGIIILVGLFILLPIILFLSQQKTDFSKMTGNKTVIIDNQNNYNKGIQPKTFSSIGTSTYVSVALNITEPDIYYHGDIREGTFENKDGRISFILDIPRAKMSWNIGQIIDSDGYGIRDVFISCVTKDLLIYPELEGCVDRSNGGISKDPAKTKYFDIVKILPLSGPSYYITYARTDTGDDSLSITTYTNNGAVDAQNALASLGFDISQYVVVYINKSL